MAGQGPVPGGRHRRPDRGRRAAYDVLRAVDERAAYANLALPARLEGLDARDARLATELTYGTLRSAGSYDAILQECVDRPLGRVDPPVVDVLRLGTHQLLATRIPSHAAVSATVDLARAVVGERPARFVNAVLRKVETRDLAGWHALVAPGFDADPIGHLAIVHAHPRWIVSAFADALGGELAETAAALAADNEPAPVTLAARPGQASREELLAYGATAARFSPYAAHVTGPPGRLPPVREGRAGVQDEGSQLVALALAAGPTVASRTDPGRGNTDGNTGGDAGGDAGGGEGRWLDLAAGPGGKA
ncbi:MAG: transcription antitermination factor NusB, partial [Carbonactinosporaceae bacterium]